MLQVVDGSRPTSTVIELDDSSSDVEQPGKAVRKPCICFSMQALQRAFAMPFKMPRPVGPPFYFDFPNTCSCVQLLTTVVMNRACLLIVGCPRRRQPKPLWPPHLLSKSVPLQLYPPCSCRNHSEHWARRHRKALRSPRLPPVNLVRQCSVLCIAPAYADCCGEPAHISLSGSGEIESGKSRSWHAFCCFLFPVPLRS